MTVNLTRYVAELNASVQRGGVGEHSIRSALLPELRAIAANIELINEPGATEHGNPDISIYKSAVPIGWIETKSLITDLDAFERSDQFDRYIRGFANLVVTNFNEFRWYVDHTRLPILTARIGDYRPNDGLRIDANRAAAERVPELLRSFCMHESRQARSAADLARRLSAFAVGIRQTVTGILERRDNDTQLRQELEAFRAVLIPGLSEEDFADMYAQTVAYGLFAARCAHPLLDNFDRFNAPQLLPVSNPFLRNAFGNLAGANLDARVIGLIEQICLLLNTADVNVIVEEFRNRTGLADPVVHFYETFLQSYDRDARRDRGVYYTPASVVSFIVRSTDAILKRDFDIEDGLADTTRVDGTENRLHRVQVLDPATGTGTFLLYLIEFIRDSLGGQAGLWNAYVRDELLPRMHGFEYLMAPYAIAHLKVGFALNGQGFEFNQNERLSIYLTNTLEDTAAAVDQLPFQTFLTVEADHANQIKQTRPIMVVMGNPPYAVRTGNLGPNARRLVARYTSVDGQAIREGGTLALQRSVENDYVKFIAFAQEQIERNGEGIVGYITANGYLDQPTLVGLRRSLMTAFDEILIIDLHGYARAGDGDENVFSQIGEGVAIILLVRRAGTHQREATVRYHSRTGTRSEKREWLAANDALGIEYDEVRPAAPDYRFKPEDLDVRARYRGEFVGLTEIFPLQKGAIVTARDPFAIAFTQQELLDRLGTFRDHQGTAQQASEACGIRWSGDWPNMAGPAREWLRQTANIAAHIKPITYRPFDDRYVIYSDRFLDTPCVSVMDTIVRGGGENRLLLFGRSVRYGLPDQFFVTNKLAECKAAEASKQCHAAPFYVYHDDLAAGAQANMSNAFAERLAGTWEGQIDQRSAFAYVYGMLNSNVFREEYAAQLCADYARIPIFSLPVAQEVARLGERLIDLHCGIERPNLITTFPVARQDNVVADMTPAQRWREGDSGWNLHINEDQFVGGVSDEVATARIGGYAVLDKWLGFRRGRNLSVGELLHLQRTIAALQTSLAVVGEIDDVVADLI